MNHESGTDQGAEYDDLWHAVKANAAELRANRDGRPLPDTAELLRELRDERIEDLSVRPINHELHSQRAQMTRTISATEARVHLGEVLRGVDEEHTTYYVERAGRPIAVVVPVDEYEELMEQLRGKYTRPRWLENIIRIGEDWSAERTDRTPIDWDKYIDEGREGEDED